MIVYFYSCSCSQSLASRHEKRRSTAALQNASENPELARAATFWSAARLCRFPEYRTRQIKKTL
jgi:hypothetical protein